MDDQEDQPRLRVYANPHSHLDHKGRPAGAVMLDPVQHAPYADSNSNHPTEPTWEPRQYVGARIDEKRTKITKVHVSHLNDVEQETVFAFSEEVVVLPDTQYYRERLRDGDLLCADEATARECGLPFVPISEARAKSKAAALAMRKAHHPHAPTPKWASESAPAPKKGSV